MFLIHMSQLGDMKYNSCYEKIQHRCFKNLENNIDTNLESEKSQNFLYFLEKLNRSDGFKKFESKLSVEFNTKYFLLPPIKVINLILPSLFNFEKKENEKGGNLNEIENRIKKTLIKQNISKDKNDSLMIEKLKHSFSLENKGRDEIEELENIDLKNLFPIKENLINDLRGNIVDNKEIFDFYSSENDDTLDKTNNKMIFIGFYQFLDDNNLIISKNENDNHNLIDEYNSSFNKINKNFKEKKINAQDAIDIFSKLSSIKNNYILRNSKNLFRSGSSDFIDSYKLKENGSNIVSIFEYSNIDFYLFLKSFEYLSMNIYFNKNINDGLIMDSQDYKDLLNISMNNFINFKIANFIKKRNLKNILQKKTNNKNQLYKKNLEFILNRKIVILILINFFTGLNQFC